MTHRERLISFSLESPFFPAGIKNVEPEEIEINRQKHENVENFKYLGFMVTNANEFETDIKARVIAGNKCHSALRHIL
jgi:hypothetical protein